MADSGIPVAALIEQSEALATAVDVLAPASSVLERLFFDDVAWSFEDDTLSMWLSLILDGQLAFDLPGGFALKIGEGDGITPLVFALRASPAGVAVAVEELAVVLAIPSSLLRPAPDESGGETAEHVELVVDGGIELDESRRLRVEGFDNVALPRCFVGGTSIVISATDIAIDTARGLVLGEARIELPKDLPQLAPEDLVLENAIVGPNGVTGRLEAQYTPEFDEQNKVFVGRGAGEIGGVPFAFASIAIELRDNALVEGSLSGQLLLPYFDVPTAVTITLRTDNSFSIELGGEPPLATIEREGLLRLDIEHLGFEVANGKLQIHAGGMVTLLLGDEEWPSFRATDVAIDADGNITVHGLGLVLRDGKPLDLGGAPSGGKLPGVTVDKLDLSGNPLDDGLVADAELSIATTSGPFVAVMQGLGAHAKLAVVGTRPVANDLDVRPPRRIAIGVESEFVVGGGLLERDEAETRFAGGLELKIKRYGIAALALIEKREGNWSLLAVLAGRFPGIPLGFGFYLDGIGGILATHREVDVDRLRAGLRDHTLDGVLFPEDIAKQATTMLDKLGAAFPVAPGRFIVGPMVKIGWGITRVVSAELAVVFELPTPARILFLAQVHASLPRVDKPLIVLNIDALGVLDLPGRRVSIDATLHDSKLVKYDISGDLCVRFGWGDDNADLIASVGGFHPRFEPPAEVPALRRVALTIGKNPLITLDLYLAVTSNTAQLGARAKLVVLKSGFSIDAGLGFDALFQFDPFAFEVDVTAWAAIQWHGKSLAGVRLEGTLSGPSPWRARGKASFDVAWWTVSVDFDETFGDDEREQLEAAPDPRELVRARLADPKSWWSESRGATVKLARYAGNDIVVDPQGSLFMKQDAVPLDCTITRIGPKKLASPARVSINSVNVHGGPVSFAPIDSQFAPAQFIELSETEKLAAPGFEAMHAGATLGAKSVRSGAGRRNIAIEYATEIVDPDHHEPPSGPRPLGPQLFDAVLAMGAAARARSRQVPTLRPRLFVEQQLWSVAAADDLSSEEPAGTSFANARERLLAARSQGSRVVLVQRHEVEST